MTEKEYLQECFKLAFEPRAEFIEKAPKKRDFEFLAEELSNLSGKDLGYKTYQNAWKYAFENEGKEPTTKTKNNLSALVLKNQTNENINVQNENIALIYWEQFKKWYDENHASQTALNTTRDNLILQKLAGYWANYYYDKEDNQVIHLITYKFSKDGTFSGETLGSLKERELHYGKIENFGAYIFLTTHVKGRALGFRSLLEIDNEKSPKILQGQFIGTNYEKTLKYGREILYKIDISKNTDNKINKYKVGSPEYYQLLEKFPQIINLSNIQISQHTKNNILIKRLSGVYLDFFYDFAEDELEWNVYELFSDGSFNRADDYGQKFEGSWIITGENMFLRIVDRKVGSNRYYDTTFKILNPKAPDYLVDFGHGLNQNHKIKSYKDVMIKQTKPFNELEANRVPKNSPEYHAIITEFPDLEKHLFSYSPHIFTPSSIAQTKFHNPDLAQKYFNSACFLAMKGKKDEALTDIDLAFNKYGFRDKSLLGKELQDSLKSIQNQIDAENWRILK